MTLSIPHLLLALLAAAGLLLPVRLVWRITNPAEEREELRRLPGPDADPERRDDD